MQHDADNPELPKPRPRRVAKNASADAPWQPGLFTNQVPACKFRDLETLEYLERAFALEKVAAPDPAAEGRSACLKRAGPVVAVQRGMDIEYG